MTLYVKQINQMHETNDIEIMQKINVSFVIYQLNRDEKICGQKNWRQKTVKNGKPIKVLCSYGTNSQMTKIQIQTEILFHEVSLFL